MYRAVVETFIHGIQAQRVASLRAQSNQRTARARLRHLLYSYFLPSLSVGRTKTGYHYVVILARLSTESTEVPRAIFDELIQPVRSLYLKALGELFPDAPEADILEALAMGVTLMATLLTRRPPEGESLVPVEKAESDASRLAEFVAAGFESWFGSPGPSCERAGLAAKPLRPPASAAR
ncbi:hypothetical protein [Burkholderia gladioli]|nr:hypothetical protein DM48_7339 [Burkholderia gladioli]